MPMSVQAGGTVVLRGSGTDPEGGALSYLWTQIAGPPVSLSGASSATASFTAPIAAVSLDFELRVTDAENLSGAATINVLVVSGMRPCAPTMPPASLGLGAFDTTSFYKKHCDADGIPILSSSNVSNRALEFAAYTALEMMKFRPEIADALRKSKVRIAIIALSEATTDVPEQGDLYVLFPGTDWDVQRGTSSYQQLRPVSSVGEENIVCGPNDPHQGESILIHEFAHMVDIMGARVVDPGFASRLDSAYGSAMAAGRWKDTYATTNKEEYWAEGVQDWFNANLESRLPNGTADGIHNHVNTREELLAYDPGLYTLVSGIFAQTDIPLCPP